MLKYNTFIQIFLFFWKNLLIGQKGMNKNHKFCYSFPLLSSLLKKEGRRKWEWRVKILIESHAFLLDHFQPIRMYIEASIKLSHFSGCSYKKEQVVRSYPPSMTLPLLLAKNQWNKTSDKVLKRFSFISLF